MSKSIASCRKRYKALVISEPSGHERMLAKWLALINEKLDGLGYKYVADRHGQFRLVLTDGSIYNSEYYKALYKKRIAEQRARKSALSDAENEDSFFKAMRKVQERSVYGMHTIYEPKQLTIDDVLNEHSNK